jgi:hypothetical protein
MIEEVNLKDSNTAPSLQGHNKAPSGHQPQGAEAAEASKEDTEISPHDYTAYSVVKTRATPQEHVKSQYRRKRRLPKLRHIRISRSRSYILPHAYSPYVLEYVGNQQPTASVASASHSQASWAHLPPPPLLPPTLTRSQQPEGHQHAQQQHDFREEY